MNNPIFDAEERKKAIDPAHSFIVQAPAGSGKTELLTQRFLVLLATVKQPEEIIAITFTKKSAAEMRARIIHALQNAHSGNNPDSDHGKLTLQLSRFVLQRSEALQWNLLQNPNRLRIQTIDSFNAYLTRQLPILSRFGAAPDISDNPELLYQLAVEEFLTHLEENMAWSDAIAQLLIHMDNDLNKVHQLLVNMLAKRDQWLPYITLNANHPELRTQLETHLKAIVTDCLIQLNKVIPENYHAELITLARYAATHIIDNNSPLRHCLEICELPKQGITDRILWCGLSELLFTQSLEWRKRFTLDEGFPAPSQTKNAAEKAIFKEYKERIQQLVSELSQYPDILAAFNELHSLPEALYQDIQWQTLEALHLILRVVVAQLHVIFQEHGKIDFIESAQAALTALGTDEAPTDLSLILDYHIRHILIDEFQDTSHSQYRLLEKLTAGWEPQDGRTLFLVGDPMQSIYRFREAEVGLFMRARKYGIGHVKLIPLTLSVNFRSTKIIVNWINTHFQTVFPTFEDIAMGAVTYNPSLANQNELQSDSTVMLHAYSSDDNGQTQGIIDLIRSRKEQNPNESIAILIRSRSHLSAIIASLKQANLAFRAIDIDPLITRPVIQDLLSLTKALLNPVDRIAWLSLLRAPWCGLTLDDLLIVSRHSHQKTLWEQLQKPSVIQELSIDGQARLARILPILCQKISERFRHSLHAWIKSTWLLLGGPATTQQESDLEDAYEYFKLLDQLEVGGDIPNLPRLSSAISQLYASPNQKADHTLQIMTIHNAKGLEFDTVILPHLERKAPNDQKQLLLWMERTHENHANGLILAPISAVGNEKDTIYDYIKKQQAIKSDYEMGRLLYVAATRAKKQLHLFFSVRHKTDGISNPISSSLLEKLWPSIKQSIQIPVTQQTAIHHPFNEKKSLSRLSLHGCNPIREDNPSSMAYHNDNTGFKLQDTHAKRLGTVIHLLLQQLASLESTWWLNQSHQQKQSYLSSLLLQQGITQHRLTESIDAMMTAIDNMLNDPQGQWILKKHREAHCEFPITTVIDGRIQQLVIDRTFVDENNIRWIIDYKTSTLTDSEPYLPQMQRYQAALQHLDQREIRMALYFPLVPRFVIL